MVVAVLGLGSDRRSRDKACLPSGTQNYESKWAGQGRWPLSETPALMSGFYKFCCLAWADGCPDRAPGRLEQRRQPKEATKRGPKHLTRPVWRPFFYQGPKYSLHPGGERGGLAAGVCSVMGGGAAYKDKPFFPYLVSFLSCRFPRRGFNITPHRGEVLLHYTTPRGWGWGGVQRTTTKCAFKIEDPSRRKPILGPWNEFGIEGTPKPKAQRDPAPQKENLLCGTPL
jgi:hypothetical protein